MGKSLDLHSLAAGLGTRGGGFEHLFWGLLRMTQTPEQGHKSPCGGSHSTELPECPHQTEQSLTTASVWGPQTRLRLVPAENSQHSAPLKFWKHPKQRHRPQDGRVPKGKAFSLRVAQLPTRSKFPWITPEMQHQTPYLCGVHEDLPRSPNSLPRTQACVLLQCPA